MDYGKHYDKLITRAIGRQLPNDVLTEIHHIVPRCMGGTNDKDNLIELTGEEHLCAHILLIKMFPEEEQLLTALKLMLQVNKYTAGTRGSFNKKYSNWRKLVSKYLKDLRWWNNGKKNRRAKDCPGDGWEIGMLNPPWNYGKVLGRCWTNGTRYVIQKESPGEDWYLGSPLKGRFLNKTKDAQEKSGHKGTRWWNNGENNKRAFTSPGSEWSLGALIKSSGSTSMTWWNNGVAQTMAHSQPGPEWIKGRLRQKTG